MNKMLLTYNFVGLCYCLLFILYGYIINFTAMAESSSGFSAYALSETALTMTTQCEFYNTTCGATGTCDAVEECGVPIEGKKSHCFVLWSRHNETGSFNVTLKGCFLNSEDCYNQTKCVDRAPYPRNNLFFCCCEGNMCNTDFAWIPGPTDETPPSSTEILPLETSNIIIYIAIAVICIGIIILLVIWFILRRQRKKHYFDELPTIEADPPNLDTNLIHLVLLIGKGNFGNVWKAQFKMGIVAVKVMTEKQSWQAEQDIYKHSYMVHPNILRFIGAEKINKEYWLITDYHENGSLSDYLKSHIITWKELCRISEGMARGLMYLHETGRTSSEVSKPSIAHRDLKSKNILLKDDLTACIADFGLAIVFEETSCGDTHGQVGTRRYMPPEVLEGAINFTPEAFLRIDMYACSLVLWELVSRCKAPGGPIAEYRLPFEDEVGSHPTMEDMQFNVVDNKVRPAIQDHWRIHPGIAMLCDTMEECWDQDPEARLSASCVYERIIRLSNKYEAETNNCFIVDNEVIPLTQRNGVKVIQN